MKGRKGNDHRHPGSVTRAGPEMWSWPCFLMPRSGVRGEGGRWWPWALPRAMGAPVLSGEDAVTTVFQTG